MVSAETFVVRCLAAGDVLLMRDILKMFGDAFADPTAYCDAPPCDAYLSRLLGCDHVIALAALKGERIVAGLAAYELEKFERERSEIYIYDLAVDAAHRRQGIATALIEALRRIAATRGAHVVFVQANIADAPAIGLYTSLGTREDVLHFDIAVG